MRKLASSTARNGVTASTLRAPPRRTRLVKIASRTRGSASVLSAFPKLWFHHATSQARGRRSSVRRGVAVAELFRRPAMPGAVRRSPARSGVFADQRHVRPSTAAGNPRSPAAERPSPRRSPPPVHQAFPTPRLSPSIRRWSCRPGACSSAIAAAPSDPIPVINTPISWLAGKWFIALRTKRSALGCQG